MRCYTSLKSAVDALRAAAELEKKSEGGNSGESFLNDSDCESGDEDKSVFTTSFPGLSVSAFQDWVGQRLIWWPEGIVNRRRVAITSSRLTKRLDRHHAWFEMLRTAILRCDSEKDCIVRCDGTASDEFAGRAAELWGIPCLRIVPPITSCGLTDPDEWYREVLSEVESLSTPDGKLAFVSPRISDRETSASHFPLSDCLQHLAAQHLVCLYSRDGGNMAGLLEHQLRDSRLTSPVLLSSIKGQVVPQCHKKLTQLGAVSWILDRSLPREPLSEMASSGSADQQVLPNAGRTPKVATSSPALSGPLQHPEEWLCHWTRPRHGAWIGQQREEFLDELLLGCHSADRTAFAALMRILHQQIIRATRSVKDAPSTVSLTEVALKDFRQHRVFRRHKQQFDFEPWGVAIRKDVLRRLGGKPVCYVDDQSESLDLVAEGEFIQPATNRRGTIDWQVEKEWRVSGDLDFSSLADSEVVVFVDTEVEQRRLLRECRYSVVIVPAAVE